MEPDYKKQKVPSFFKNRKTYQIKKNRPKQQQTYLYVGYVGIYSARDIKVAGFALFQLSILEYIHTFAGYRLPTETVMNGARKF